MVQTSWRKHRQNKKIGFGVLRILKAPPPSPQNTKKFQSGTNLGEMFPNKSEKGGLSVKQVVYSVNVGDLDRNKRFVHLNMS